MKFFVLNSFDNVFEINTTLLMYFEFKKFKLTNMNLVNPLSSWCISKNDRL